MSSIAGSYSQVAPFKRWLVGTGTGRIYDKTGANAVTVTGGVVLKDMGKTQFATAPVAPATAGAVLRKVAVLPTPATTGPVVTGYIYLSDAVPALQNVLALN